MAAADGQCEPAGFNLFVFVGGRFAGTLSPDLMAARHDRSAGVVRIRSGDAISVEFVRYVNDDPACCPSAHVTVRYRVDRGGRAPVIVPIEAARTRG